MDGASGSAGADRFRELDRLFQAVCDLPAHERAIRLAQLAPMDEAIRDEVLGLLSAEESGVLSPERVHEQVARTLAEAGAEPERIAGFEIIGRLGAGGMGVVYEAEQDRPKRRVALKVLRPGLATPELVRRFEFEAEALGRLQHPGIARVYEAGVAHTPVGPRPYFAMELVRGEPIDAWMRRSDASLDDRLRLFVKVCEAVQHAHAQGVIHRDLKPANILVDERGEPRVLDFGVARAAGETPETQAITTHTSAGQLVGTVPYMSPEQVSGEPGEVDTRTDVYCLGVVLHEMLAGGLPYDLEGLAIFEAARVIAETPPAKLSAANGRLRGDVETIVGKALRKDKASRYQTAEAMAEDIRRHLSGQTISARPPSARYQLSRFAKRHRGVVAAAGVVLAALVLGIAGTTAGLVEARRQASRAEDRTLEAQRQTDLARAQREEAERRTAIAEGVTGFLNNDVLAAVAPSRLGLGASVMDALDASAGAIGERFEQEPVTRAAILNNIGNVYHALGEYAKAEPLIREAGELFDRELGTGHELSINARGDLGRLLVDTARYAEADSVYADVRDRAEHALGPAHDKTLETLITQAQLAFGASLDYQAATALLDEFDARSAGLPDDDPNVLYAQTVRGGMALEFGESEVAERAYRRVLAGRERSRGPDDPSTMIALHNLATALEQLGRRDEAEPMYERVLEVERERSGPDNPDVLVSAHNLAFLRHHIGRHEEAEAMYLDTLERCRRVFGDAHPGTLTCTGSLASLYNDTGRTGEAIELIEAARERALGSMPPLAPAMVELTSKLAVMLAMDSRFDEANPLFQQTAAAWRMMLPPGHREMGTHLSSWGASRLGAGDAQGAVATLTEAHDILSNAGDVDGAKQAAARLARAYEALGDEAEAAAWRERAGD